MQTVRFLTLSQIFNSREYKSDYLVKNLTANNLVWNYVAKNRSISSFERYKSNVGVS